MTMEDSEDEDDLSTVAFHSDNDSHLGNELNHELAANVDVVGHVPSVSSINTIFYLLKCYFCYSTISLH
jgi:hypothetical protein